MRVLADENVARLIVTTLSECGHDVVWARDVMCGASDSDVLSRAQREDRVVVTSDKGFSDLAFRRGLPSICGIVLLRVRGAGPDELARIVAAAIGTRPDWRGVFATVGRERIRVRPLPTPRELS
jgi:predicted nuclease of predicted toxin-antitoxin system